MNARPWRVGLALLVLAGAMAAMPAAAARTGTSEEARPEVSFPDERPTFGSRDGAAEFAPGQVIVKFSDGVGSAGQADVRQEEGLSKEADLDLVNAEVVDTEGRPADEVIADLEADPRVEYAERDRVVEPMGYGDEPRFDELWGLDNTGQVILDKVGTADVDVDALEASAITQGSEDVVVAVIDDGVDFSHPELQGKQWVNTGEIPDNNVDDDGNGYIDDVNGYDFGNDDNTVHDELQDGHGTHVAGTIAASVNDAGVVGVAPDVRIMAVKIFGSVTTLSSVIQGIEYASENGARISNNSWGYVGKPSPLLKEAIRESGQLFVAAAGNDGINNDNLRASTYPASYDLPNILSVAAVNNRGRLAKFSSFGSRAVDISAPGVDVLSSIPSAPARSGAVLSQVGTGRAVTAGFGVEEISGEGDRADFMRRSLEAVEFDFCPSDPNATCADYQREVLLVDDDLSTVFDGAEIADAAPPVRAAIEDATQGTPTTVAVVEVGPGDGPDIARMQQADAVVWTTGWAFFSTDEDLDPFKKTLTFVDQNNLARYLGGGGKLVLHGMDALFDLEGSAFVNRTLGLDVQSDIHTTVFDGATGTRFEDASYELQNRPYSITYFHDAVEPGEANAVSLGDGSVPQGYVEYASGTSMATPHATGTAALVASKYPDLLDTPTGLRRQVLANGKPAPFTRGKTVTGRIVDADGALTNSGPTITNVAPRGAISGDRVRIFATVLDAQSLLAASQDVRLFVDGGEVSAFYDPQTGKLVYAPQNLKNGRHNVRIEATDPEGLSATKTWTFTK